MAQIKLNKSSLSREVKNLKNYDQFLPSLDLKRRKLLAVKMETIREYAEIEAEISDIERQIKSRLPMACYDAIKLEELINVNNVVLQTENVVGVRLPVCNEVEFSISKYSYFNTPFWVDEYIELMKKAIISKIKIKVAKTRIELIEKSLIIVTQRKNFFEKVLIPKTKNTIRNIQLFLSDNERSAVVRSKIAKHKRTVV